MTTNSTDVVAPAKASAASPREDAPGFEARWTAWQAKGAAQDRAFERKMAIAGPIVLLVAAVVLYSFFGR